MLVGNHWFPSGQGGRSPAEGGGEGRRRELRSCACVCSRENEMEYETEVTSMDVHVDAARSIYDGAWN